MKKIILMIIGGVTLSLFFVSSAMASSCPKDSVRAGRVCVDKYEASVWKAPSNSPQFKKFLKLIKRGHATESRLIGLGAVRYGDGVDDYDSANCPNKGNGCKDLYAVSVPGVKPSTYITWFQAAAVCRNAHKSLLTNADWQVAALGTPDTGGADDGVATCNTDDHEPNRSNAGSRSACKSDIGAYDMVGNVWEWVADWVPRSTTLGSWGDSSGDRMGFAGAATTGQPGVLIRGGAWGDYDTAGVFAISGGEIPSADWRSYIGFRCGR